MATSNGKGGPRAALSEVPVPFYTINFRPRRSAASLA